mmetsp:Transcript_20578/g.37558  ORF Transcript_20578/g.37558 Transcript_20578/m.37558 type:complete len:172 (-) Transcript_20578:75-590(-)
MKSAGGALSAHAEKTGGQLSTSPWQSEMGLHTLFTPSLGGLPSSMTAFPATSLPCPRPGALGDACGPAPASALASTTEVCAVMGVRDETRGCRYCMAVRARDATEGLGLQLAGTREDGEALAVEDLERELLGDLPLEQQESWLESLRNEVARMPPRPPPKAISPAPTFGTP